MELYVKPNTNKDVKLFVKSDANGGTPIKVENRDQLKELRGQYGIEHIMNTASEHGIKHNGTTAHQNYNYMKTAMAIGDHIDSGKDFHVKKPFKSEKGNYHVKLRGDGGKSVYKQVEGETVDLGMDGIQGFVHRNEDGSHTVSCRRTGLALSGRQGTRLEAIEHAKTRLGYYKDSVATAISKHPSVPGFGDGQKPKKEKVKKSTELDWGFID